MKKDNRPRVHLGKLHLNVRATTRWILRARAEPAHVRESVQLSVVSLVVCVCAWSGCRACCPTGVPRWVQGPVWRCFRPGDGCVWIVPVCAKRKRRTARIPAARVRFRGLSPTTRHAIRNRAHVKFRKLNGATVPRRGHGPAPGRHELCWTADPAGSLCGLAYPAGGSSGCADESPEPPANPFRGFSSTGRECRHTHHRLIYPLGCSPWTK